MASQLQKQVYQAYLDAGLSPSQARIITAEVGRENSFNPNTVFGVHSDPKNKALNLGMLSWQGSRAKSLYNYMHSKGLIQNGSMVRNQAALNEMARFSVNEMRNNKSYAQTAKTFLSNPNIDYQTGAAVLGKNYIRWRYDDPKYKSGHQNRDHFYRAMSGSVQQQAAQPQFTDLTKLGYKPQKTNTPQPNFVDLTKLGYQANQQTNQPQFVDLKALGYKG